MRKFITYFFLVLSSLIVIVAFMTATTYLQLVLASIFYAAIVYFLLRTFPRNVSFHQLTPVVAAPQPTAMPTAQTPGLTTNNLPVADNNKRDLLKMVGAAGLSFFLFSIFNRRPGGSFFGSAPGLPLGATSIEDTTGKKIDPAKSQPTDGYRISEIDDSVISYYGFINHEGNWFIMKEDADSGSFRYIKGDTDFPGHWTDRQNLVYDYYYKVF